MALSKSPEPQTNPQTKQIEAQAGSNAGQQDKSTPKGGPVYSDYASI